MLDDVHAAIASLPVALQLLAVAALAAVPFIEAHGGAFLGVLAGMPLALAIIAAVAGNILSTLGFIFGASAVRARSGADTRQLTPRRERLRRGFERWGVPGVSLFGQWILPSQLSAAAMVGFGAARKRVILWQIVSIVLWGVAFGLLGLLVGELITWSERQ